MRINTGRAVRKSGSKGREKLMVAGEIEILRDNSERRAYDAVKYLPHQGEREIARRLRRGR
jgi:tRNA(Ile2) C34 agmatinyltransferase TiaS